MPSYTTQTNKLKIAELDFDSIKSALRTYLQGQDVFKDYDFEGSAMSILLDILSYNTHYNGFYANMLASEMFMDSASLRSSIVSLAKHLGYTPSSRKGASVKLDIAFTSDSASLTDIIIPKNSKFTSKIRNETYTFLMTESRAAKLNATRTAYSASGIEIKEGILSTSTQTAIGSDNEIFAIPNENVDIATLQVSLGGEIYKPADDYTEITSASKVYFLQEGRDGGYEVYFGDGVIGKAPTQGDIVELQYSVSMLGSEGNGAKKFVLAETISGITSVTIGLSAGYTRSSGGAEKEKVSSIRIQAPRQHALQKRVVTANDYKTRLKNDYDIIDSVRVWGGETNIPPLYGKVFISIKPKIGYVLSNAEKRRVANDILKKRNMVTIGPVFVDPDYLFVVPDVTFAYDPRKTTRTIDQLIAMVKVTISSYSSESLGVFDEYFRHSILSRKIDDTEDAIISNNMNIAIKKRIKPILGTTRSYRKFFDNPFFRPHPGHRNILTSTTFTYNGKTNCSLVDKDGVISVVVQKDFRKEYNSTNGTYGPRDSELGYVVDGKVGNLNYETGEVFLENFRPTSINDGSEYIYISAKPRIDDVLPRGNTIVTIEAPDINVTAVDDTDRLEQMKTQSY